jgi:hypothetical protein
MRDGQTAARQPGSPLLSSEGVTHDPPVKLLAPAHVGNIASASKNWQWTGNSLSQVSRSLAKAL